MLRWSATETGRAVELAGIIDPAADPGLPGGRELVTLAREVRLAGPDRRALDRVADVIGLPAAVDAAAVAANFQVMNRVVDATGLPIGKRRRDDNAALIASLKLDRFPHAQH
jgi:hypothetical protein